MAGISLGKLSLGGKNSGFNLYIPPKYRSLVGLLSTIGITLLVAFLLGTIPQAKEVFMFYIPAFVAVVLLFASAIYSIVKDFKRDYIVKKVNKTATVGMSIADFAQSYGVSEEIAIKKLAYVISIGQTNLALNLDTKTIDACAEGTPIKDRFIGEGVYAKQRKKLMLGNLLAFGILIFAFAVNSYYIINAVSGLMTDSIGGFLTNLLLVAPFAAVIIFATGISAMYLPNHLLKNSKADGTKLRKLTKWFRVLNIISLIAMPIIMIIVVASMAPAG